jgi:dTDP-4-dehydrorhamnose reductase
MDTGMNGSKEMAQRLLLTGASGFLGSACRAAWADAYTIIPLCSRRTLSRPGLLPCDITDYGEVKAVLAEHRPDCVVHLAAIRDANLCQKQPLAAARVNTQATGDLAGLCADRHLPFVFTSTDLVFDGREAPYSEADSVNPLSAYGEQKALAEELVRARWPAAVIARLPLLFGPVGEGTENYAASFLAALEAGQPQRLFVDEFRTPLSGTDAADGVRIALESGHAGLLHLGGAERVSRYEFGQAICRAAGVADSALEPIHQVDLTMAAPRPQDVSLSSELAGALGFEPRALAAALQDLA